MLMDLFNLYSSSWFLSVSFPTISSRGGGTRPPSQVLARPLFWHRGHMSRIVRMGSVHPSDRSAAVPVYPGIWQQLQQK